MIQTISIDGESVDLTTCDECGLECDDPVELMEISKFEELVPGNAPAPSAFDFIRKNKSELIVHLCRDCHEIKLNVGQWEE